MSARKGAGKSRGNRWSQNSASNSGAIRRQPFGMNRSSPLDREGLEPNTARRSMGLLDVMIEQLTMLTEEGLRDLQLAVATEIAFRGDVRESLNEQREADRVNGSSEFANGMTAADLYDPFDRPQVKWFQTAMRDPTTRRREKPKHLMTMTQRLSLIAIGIWVVPVQWRLNSPQMARLFERMAILLGLVAGGEFMMLVRFGHWAQAGLAWNSWRCWQWSMKLFWMVLALYLAVSQE